jgi:hypothetical protein
VRLMARCRASRCLGARRRALLRRGTLKGQHRGRAWRSGPQRTSTPDPRRASASIMALVETAAPLASSR